MGEPVVRRWFRSLGSLRLRVALGAAAVVGVVLTATSVVVVHAVRSSIRDQIHNEGVTLTKGIASKVTSGLFATQGPAPVPPPMLPLTLPSSGTPAFVQIVGADGQIVARSPVPSGGMALATNPKPGSFVKVTAPANTPRGRLQVIAELPLTRVQRSVDAVIHVLLFVLPFLVIAAGGLAWLLVSRALRPVDAIRAEVDEITHTTITRRVPEPGSRDEINRLARTMNAMLGRLETTARRQREFVSNASHELRSPLASAHAILEAAAHAPKEADWPHVAHETLAEQARLAAIIDELLELARFDETSIISQRHPVDLDEIVFTEAKRLRGKAIDLSAVSGARLDGDPVQLTGLVRNLLLNAQRHARRRVAVTVAADGDDVRLTVDDDGDGIPEPERHRVFERFVRRDDARAREHGGVGLGLALVASIVQQHHGVVTIEDSPLGGARLSVSLPQVATEWSPNGHPAPPVDPPPVRQSDRSPNGSRRRRAATLLTGDDRRPELASASVRRRSRSRRGR